MRMRFWIKASLILPALCLAGLTAYAQQQGSSQQQTSDPVADAARKAREEKKNAQKPKKVYTDDDVGHNLGGPAAPSSGTGTGSAGTDRKSTRLNSSHGYISYAVFCLKKKKKTK